MGSLEGEVSRRHGSKVLFRSGIVVPILRFVRRKVARIAGTTPLVGGLEKVIPEVGNSTLLPAEPRLPGAHYGLGAVCYLQLGEDV